MIGGVLIFVVLGVLIVAWAQIRWPGNPSRGRVDAQGRDRLGPAFDLGPGRERERRG